MLVTQASTRALLLKMHLCEALPCSVAPTHPQHQLRLLELYHLCLPLGLQGRAVRPRGLLRHLSLQVDSMTTTSMTHTNTHQEPQHLGREHRLQDKHHLPQCHQCHRHFPHINTKKRTMTMMNYMPLRPANPQTALEDLRIVQLHLCRHKHHLNMTEFRRLYLSRVHLHLISTLHPLRQGERLSVPR